MRIEVLMESVRSQMMTIQVNRECTRMDADLAARHGNAIAPGPLNSRSLAFIRGSRPEQLHQMMSADMRRTLSNRRLPFKAKAIWGRLSDSAEAGFTMGRSMQILVRSVPGLNTEADKHVRAPKRTRCARSLVFRTFRRSTPFRHPNQAEECVRIDDFDRHGRMLLAQQP
jgi:hypothetical protein